MDNKNSNNNKNQRSNNEESKTIMKTEIIIIQIIIIVYLFASTNSIYKKHSELLNKLNQVLQQNNNNVIDIYNNVNKSNNEIPQKLKIDYICAKDDKKKKKIKINFVNFWTEFSKENDIFTRILRKHYDVEISSNPDYIFYSVFGKSHNKYNDKKYIKIQYMGENRRPSFKDADYSMAFDYLDKQDRYLRFPIYLHRYEEALEIKLFYLNERPYKPNKKFCACLITNRRGTFRNNFIEELSKYKKIDNGGKYKNNIGKILPRDYKVKNAFLKEYKFSIAMENSKRNGYLTEKLLESFLGHVYYLILFIDYSYILWR